MLEKKVVIDLIQVLEDGQIQIRQKTSVLEDEKELSYSYHRWCKAPDDNITDQTDKVKAIAGAVWTKDVKDAYIAKKVLLAK